MIACLVIALLEIYLICKHRKAGEMVASIILLFAPSALRSTTNSWKVKKMANEKRLIDANALIEALPIVTEDRKITLYGAVADFMIMISAMPTVDAVEVVHGRWIHVPSSDMMTGKAYKCSECGKMRYGSFMPNYCQICGAKMDMEVDI